MAVEADVNEQEIISYVLKNGDDLNFTKYFWRRCEPLPRDVELYRLFVRAVKNRVNGIESPDAFKQIGVGLGTVDSYSKLDVMPKLAHYLKAFLEYGQPAPGKVWLTTDCTHGQAIPIGQFIEVPLVLDSWEDAERVVGQLRGIGEAAPVESNEFSFGFFLGIMIGDAAKKKQGRGHRLVHLVLSKKYDTNLKIGEYTRACALALGLRMHRAKDIEKAEDKPFGFYQWISQSSPACRLAVSCGLRSQGGRSHHLQRHQGRLGNSGAC